MNKGFSLIEMLIVVTILLTLLGGGMISYTRFNTRRVLAKDVSTFSDVVSGARQKTIDRDLGDTVDCTTFEGYQIRVDPSTSSYELYKMCTGLSLPAIASYELSDSEIDGASIFTIDFEYPYGTLKGADRIVTFRNTALNECQTVHITTAGIISEQPC